MFEPVEKPTDSLSIQLSIFSSRISAVCDEPVFYIGRKRGAPEHCAHLITHRRTTAGKNTELSDLHTFHYASGGIFQALSVFIRPARTLHSALLSESVGFSTGSNI